jgi:hypothetical protein
VDAPTPLTPEQLDAAVARLKSVGLHPLTQRGDGFVRIVLAPKGYVLCDDCGDPVPGDDVVDGLCKDCRA